MQILHLSRRFLDSLSNDLKVIKTLRVYGYSSPESFLASLISFLNVRYDFINITKVEAFSKDVEKIYNMYNGYISGNLGEYEEIVISLTVMKDGKLGNVFVTQQIMPMITAKLEISKDFLLNPKIKRIVILTTHLSSKMSPSANQIIGYDNTGTMVLKLLNVLGFDVNEFFEIKNAQTNSSYSTLEEFIDHSDYINSRKKMNLNHNHISIKDEQVIISLSSKDKVEGQTIKFVLLKALGSIHLSDGRYIDLSDLINRTEQINKNGPAKNALVIQEYADYILKKEIPSLFVGSQDNSSVESSLPKPYQSGVRSELYVEEHFRSPEYTYNNNGRRVYKTLRDKKIEALKLNSYLCSCHDESHMYFISNSSKENYLEGHHLIPMEYQNDYWKDYRINLDSTINIVPLCPNCHQKIHKAVKSQRLEILMDVYRKYENNIKILDKQMDFDKFASLYNVYIY